MLFSIGKYLYIESSNPRRPGDIAALLSATFPPTSGMCFSFWYHMYGTTIGTLQVLLQVAGSNASSIWELTGNKGNTWYQGQVSFTPSSQWQVSLSLEQFKGDSSNLTPRNMNTDL